MSWRRRILRPRHRQRHRPSQLPSRASGRPAHKCAPWPIARWKSLRAAAPRARCAVVLKTPKATSAPSATATAACSSPYDSDGTRMPDHASSRHPSESNPSLRLEAALDLLVHGEIEMQGLLPYSSNYTFLVI